MTDESGGPDRAGRTRWLRRAGAVAAAVGLAGCSSTGDGEVDATASAAPTRTAGEPTTSTPPSAGGTPTARPPSPTPSCEATVDELRDELSAVERELESVREAHETTQRTLSELRAVRDYYPDGWSSAMVDAARAVGEQIRPSVIVLEFEGGGGTGWFINEHHVVTNSHVVRSEGTPTGWTIDGESFTLERVASDDDLSPDLALLRTDFSGTPLPTADHSDLEPRTPVVHVGHPFGAGNWVIALGHSLWKQEQDFIGIDPTTVLYSSVPGRQGVSGAPLVTLDGAVVGVTYGAISRAERVRSEAPEPADTRVIDYEIAPKVWGNHVPIEIVEAKVEEWTA